MRSETKRLPCGRKLEACQPHLKRKGPDLKASRAKLALYLKSRDLKKSPSRTRLVEVLLDPRTPDHFSVPVLVDRARELKTPLSVATIYRNLPVLLECGILKETFTDDQGQKIYERGRESHLQDDGQSDDDTHHDHLVCLDCRHIFEFHDESIESAQEQITQAMRFQTVRHRHVIYARCAFRLKRPVPKP